MLRKALPMSAALVLLVANAVAQDPIPASTQMYQATLAYVYSLGTPDLIRVASQAQSGDREAQYLMALAYEGSRLLPQDLAAARSWMLKSAEQGYLPAQTGMGHLYIAGITSRGPIPHRADAEKWFRLAAERGDADAQFWLGTAYQRGWFGAFDDREALKWLRKAAAQGLPTAQLSLGQMYEEGEGVPESDALAASWYRKAADHFPEDLVGASGVWQAEVQLTYMYRQGRLPKDDVQWYMWLALVGASVNPPDDDVKEIARHMTRAQIVQARRLVKDWVERHKRQRPPSGDNTLDTHNLPSKSVR